MPADIDSALRSLATSSTAFGDLSRFLAADVIVLALIPVLAVYLRRGGLRAVVAVAAGGIGALVVAALLGMLWDRPRPFVLFHLTPLVDHAADASFPSDHLTALGAICGGVWFASRRWALAAALVALLVAVGRMAIGVHYESDVVAGFAIGVAGGVGAWLLAGRAARPLERLDALLVRTHLRAAVDRVPPQRPPSQPRPGVTS